MLGGCDRGGRDQGPHGRCRVTGQPPPEPSGPCPCECGHPTRARIEELIERGSLGTPEAKAIRASVPRSAVDRVLARVRELRDGERAASGQLYGDGGTIHNTRHLDIEIHEGQVVAVWFRCRTIAFQQVEVDAARAAEAARVPGSPLIGVVFEVE